ncbi:type II toxin-antitoxin system HigB family toxin [Botrimarina sp.]|uniref:type II toxin-antitoxin system HigB family toxin n=1 Tax=Botrimarina sp. TaxID=2795802 RepID=UPI0032ED24BA
MRVISRKTLREFWEQHPDAESPLRAWAQLVSRNRFGSFAELRRTFPTADRVGRKFVFNIGGNKYRLIAAIHFNTQVLYVRGVLSHAEYDRGDWKD